MAATILIIENDRDTGYLAAELLKHAGYGAVFTAHADEGFDVALDGAADLLLCGVDPPEAAGYEVARRLRREARWRPIPIIALLRLSRPGDHEKVSNAGFVDCLRKPLEPEIFVSQIERFLPSRLIRRRPLAF